QQSFVDRLVADLVLPDGGGQALQQCLARDGGARGVLAEREGPRLRRLLGRRADLPVERGSKVGGGRGEVRRRDGDALRRRVLLGQQVTDLDVQDGVGVG